MVLYVHKISIFLSECEYNGKKYSNGERLESSAGDECKVCYCRGGEIQCTDVSCYVRNDCEGKQVPGQCCPKYEHCPTRDSLEKLITNSTSNSNNNTSSLFNSIQLGSISLTSQNTVVSDSDANNSQVQENNGIKSEMNPIQQGNALENPKITIQEIIPDIKEIPITSNSKPDEKQEIVEKLLIAETKIPASVITEESNDLVVTDSEAESSEITEVIQNPPPVIRIGDNLLFLKKNELINEKDAISTPTSIITLVGAEGLQRGGVDEAVENITNGEVVTTPPEIPYFTIDFEDTTNDLASASSSHILSLVKKKKKPTPLVQSTTNTPILTSTSEIPSSSTVHITPVSLPTSSDSVETSTALSESSTAIQDSGSQVPVILAIPNSTEVSSFDDQPKILELEIDQNPAYPTLPDVIMRNSDDGWMKIETNKDLNQTESSVKEYEKESKILQDILEVRNNNTLPVNVSHSAWLKSSKSSREDNVVPLIDLRAALPLDILNAPNADEGDVESELIEDEDEDENVTTISSVETENIDEGSSTSLDATANPSSIKLENLTESISAETFRSVETMENSGEYSGEKTTPKSKNAAVVSQENASVEDDKKDSEVNDMLFVKEYTIDLSQDEEKKESRRNSNNSKQESEDTDVEMIDISELEKNSSQTNIPEKLPVPEKLAATQKEVSKRENDAHSEDEAVFEQLNQELGLGSTQKPKSPEEEDIEAKRVFQELLEETSTPKSQKPLEPRSKETEALDRVSQALAKLALRGPQPLDTGILSALRDFFSSQYRAYDSKSP
ncbi:hypothetical protein HHI36_009154 [Cryptolaemus montrouzieri]|uniref:VWFC domain-containing protein n=1 Tax=Cryptolaemus montrouzieri TaxID=559131 RepID=A0ABD2MUK1_9CUCU